MATKRNQRRQGTPLYKVRDAIGMTVGAFILIFETVTQQVNPYLVGAALTLLGSPTVIGAWNEARRGKEMTEDTTDSSSPSLSPSQQQP